MKGLASLQSMYFSWWLLLAVKWIPEAKELEIYNLLEVSFAFPPTTLRLLNTALGSKVEVVSSSLTAWWLSHHTLSRDGRVGGRALISKEEHSDQAHFYDCTRLERFTIFWSIYAWWQWLWQLREGSVGKLCRALVTNSIKWKNIVLGAFSLANL